jgi:hypothetical protein
MHAERGKETVEHIVRLIAGHDLNHLQQIERILGLPKASPKTPPKKLAKTSPTRSASKLPKKSPKKSPRKS